MLRINNVWGALPYINTQQGYPPPPFFFYIICGCLTSDYAEEEKMLWLEDVKACPLNRLKMLCASDEHSNTASCLCLYSPLPQHT